MLHFFRRIRRGLLSDNRFRKYLIYAIGEIFLVMIGILLALQVNNWNEQRKAKHQEIKLLKQLNSDLERNLEEIKFLIGGEHTNYTNYGLTLRSEAKDSILHYLEDADKYKEELKLYLHMLSLKGIFNLANTAYKSIESGGLDIMSNDKLRAHITEMYDHRFANIYKREELEFEIISNRLKPILQEVLIPTSVSNLFQSIALKDRFNGKYILNYPKDPLSLKGNQQFIST